MEGFVFEGGACGDGESGGGGGAGTGWLQAWVEMVEALVLWQLEQGEGIDGQAEAVDELEVELDQVGGTWPGHDEQHGLVEAAYGDLAVVGPGAGVLEGHLGVEEADPLVAWPSLVAP